MKPRRVVTGTVDGKARVVSDEVLDPITLALAPGAEFISAWAAKAPVHLSHDGSHSPIAGWFPSAGEFRFAYVTIPPNNEKAPPADLGSAVEEAEKRMPGLLATFDPEVPGMHRTDTIDWVVILAGRVWLDLGDGQEVELHPATARCRTGRGMRGATGPTSPR